MGKFKDNVLQTSSFMVLTNLLKQPGPSRGPTSVANESFATRYMEFSNWLVKCLIKLTKDLTSTVIGGMESNGNVNMVESMNKLDLNESRQGNRIIRGRWPHGPPMGSRFSSRTLNLS